MADREDVSPEKKAGDVPSEKKDKEKSPENKGSCLYRNLWKG